MDEAFKMAAIECLRETGQNMPEKGAENEDNSSERYEIAFRVLIDFNCEVSLVFHVVFLLFCCS